MSSAPPLQPYQYIVTPAITLVLKAIRGRCGVGGSITPGVRALAEDAGISSGQLSPLLYQLAADGWILYDGRVITLLADPDEPGDQWIDRLGDQSIDHPDQRADQLNDQQTDRASDQRIDHRTRRTPMPQSTERRPPTHPKPGTLADSRFDQRVDRDVYRIETPNGMTDQSADRSAAMHMESCSSSSSRSELDSAAATKNLPCADENDQSADRSDPVVVQLLELGTSPKLIAKALAARPDLTVQQVCDTHAHFVRRKEHGLVNGDLGAFYTAIADGQIHSAPPDPERPIDPSAYRGVSGYLVSDADDLPEPDEPEGETPHQVARRIAPDDCSGRDFVWLVGQLAGGASEAACLAGLADRRRR